MSETLTGLFICQVCKEIAEIPDYVPAEADNDPRIGYLAEVHLRRHPSFEDRLITDWASLGSVPTKAWESNEYRKEITKKILENHGQTGFDAEFYATQNTFKADAFACWKRHDRPAYISTTQSRCQDYLDSSKEIKPSTGVERKAAGLPSYDEVKVKRTFLCQYCPYHQSVKNEINK
jgi:hypothetical protein